MAQTSAARATSAAETPFADQRSQFLLPRHKTCPVKSLGRVTQALCKHGQQPHVDYLKREMREEPTGDRGIPAACCDSNSFGRNRGKRLPDPSCRLRGQPPDKVFHGWDWFSIDIANPEFHGDAWELVALVGTRKLPPSAQA